MIITICMPKLSPTMSSGMVARWHKAVGQRVETGDLLVEIATDKATIEHHAIDPGWLRYILIPEGKNAEVGTPIALMSSEEKEPLGELPTTPQAVSTPAIPPRASTEIIVEGEQKEKQRIRASPLARKIAQQEKISLENITGTGPGGRVMSRDLSVVLSKKHQIVSPPIDFPIPEGMETTELTPLRATVAKTLQYSKSTIPHFYTTLSVNVSPLVTERERLKAAGVHLTVNDFIIAATARALMLHPAIRSSLYDNGKILGRHPHADIAVAVSVHGGLITPIITEAENKSIFAIAQEMKLLAEQARQGKLTPKQYSGGAFTITNLGMYGVEEFFPIINPPQVAILAIGAIGDRAIIENGSVVIAKVLSLTIAGDHRAIDGSDAAAFLQEMRKQLQSPEKLVSLDRYTQTA